MCFAELTAAAFQGLAALVLAAGAGPLPWLVLLQSLVGVSRGFFYPAATGLVASLIEDERMRQKANGLLGAAQAAARLAGPPCAGLLVSLSGAEVALTLNVAAYSVSALLLVGVPSRAAAARSEPTLAAVRRGWRELRAREWLWVTVAWFSALQFLAVAPFLVLGPLVAKRESLGAGGWGLILGCVGAGAAVGAAIAAVLRTRRPLRPAIATYALYALPLLALAQSASLSLIAGAAALAGGSGGFFAATWFTVFQRNVPQDAMSRVSAWDWEASLAGLPLGMLIAPQVAHLAGAQSTLLVAAAVTVVLTALVACRPSLSAPATVAAASAPAPPRRRCRLAAPPRTRAPRDGGEWQRPG
jgi:MFS family permease